MGVGMIIAGSNIMRQARHLTPGEVKQILGDWVFSYAKQLPMVKKRLEVSKTLSKTDDIQLHHHG